jgi:hypothetical protein
MAAEDILGFLTAIDTELAQHARECEILDLYLIGRSALILGYGVQLMTKGIDVVELEPSRLFAVAVEVFKEGGPGQTRYGLYLEAVSSGLPPVPIGFQKRSVEVAGPWRVLRPKRPEPHDLVVTKLKRFHLGDREDIQILCDTSEVTVDTLRERFDLAYAFSDRDDPKVATALANLETVAEYLEGRRRAL